MQCSKLADARKRNVDGEKHFKDEWTVKYPKEAYSKGITYARKAVSIAKRDNPDFHPTKHACF